MTSIQSSSTNPERSIATLAKAGEQTGISTWRSLRWLLLLLTILIQGVSLVYQGPVVATDQMFQTRAAQSIAEGHGVTIPTFNTDMAQVIYTPLIWWPFGYSLAIVPLLQVVHDIWWATLIMDILGLVMLFASWFVILELLGDTISIWAKVFLWLYWSFIHPPVTILWLTGPTDYLALGLFWASLAFCLLSVRSRRWILIGVASGICAGCSAALRYAYWPLIAVLPVGLVIYWVLKRDSRFFKTAIVNGFVAASIVGTVALYNLVTSGQTSVLSQFSNVFSLSNLSTAMPFPVMAFGFDQLAIPFDMPTGVAIAFWGLSIVLLILCCLEIWPVARRELVAFRTRTAKPNPMALFYVAGLCTLVLVMFTLVYTAIRQPPNSTWTFLKEPRYYLPILGFILVAVVAYAFRFRQSFPFTRAAQLTLLIAMLTVGSTQAQLWYSRLSQSFPTLGESSFTGVQKALLSIVRNRVAQYKTVAFLDQGPTDQEGSLSSFYKSIASVAGAEIYRSINFAAIPESLTESQPTDLIICIWGNIQLSTLPAPLVAFINLPTTDILYGGLDATIFEVQPRLVTGTQELSLISFGNLLTGQGWGDPENTIGGTPMRWMTNTTAMIQAYVPTQSDLTIEFHTINAITPDVLNSLVLTVNGKPIPFAFDSESDGSRLYRAQVPHSIADIHPGHPVLAFSVGRVVSPHDLWGTSDTRTLGVAFDWVRLTPMPYEVF